MNGTIQKKKTPAGLGIALAFGAVYLIWGTTYLAIRFAIESIPPLTMMGVRSLAAGALLYTWARLRGHGRPRFGHWRTAAAAGSLLFLGGHGALAWSEQVLPSGIAALLVSTAPIWMTVVTVLRCRGGTIHQGLIPGLALGFLGMVLLVEPFKLLGRQSVDLTGAAVLLLGTVSWCIGSVFSKYADLPKNPLLAAGMTMLFGGGALVLLGLVTEDAGLLVTASLQSLLSLLYLVLFGSVIAFSAYIWLLKTVSPTRVSTYAFVNPIVAVVVGWLGGGEIVSTRMIAASALMIAGVMSIVFINPKRNRRHMGLRSIECAEGSD